VGASKGLDEVKGHLPNQIFSSDDAGGDGISEGVQLDLLVRFEVLLAQKDVEVGGFLD
jgi:hypothetical protein